MKYSTDSLFSIETNLHFPWIKMENDCEIYKTVQQTAQKFGISCGQTVLQVKKPNQKSSLYRIREGSMDFILRAVELSLAPRLEKQCRLVNDLRFKSICKPLRTSKGKYSILAKRQAWMAYPYHAGDIFNGQNGNTASIIYACMALLSELSKVTDRKGFEAACHTPVSWIKSLSSFFLKDFAKPPFSKHLTKKTRQVIWLNRQPLIDLVEAVSQLKTRTEICVTHNDLNHANLILNRKKAVIIDIEDICLENLKISTSHCIFKLVRHAVYSEAVSLTEGRGIIRSVLKKANSKPFHMTPQDFYGYGLYRIISDIYRLYQKTITHPDGPFPIDLEKKISNLFELHALVN